MSGRPVPDLKGFKGEVLSWDFYEDVFDEQVRQAQEEARISAEMADQKMEEAEVEEYLSKMRLHSLTEVQRLREEKQMARERAELAKLKDGTDKEKEVRAKKIQLREKTAKKHKVKELAFNEVLKRATQYGLAKVPEQFTNQEHYIKSFLPVFFWECRSQLERYKETEMKADISEKVSLDRMLLEGDHLVKLHFYRSKDACSVTQYSMEDLVLLSQEEDPSKACPVHLLGLVEHSVNQTIVMTVYLDMAAKTAGSRSKEAAKLLSEKAPWHLTKVTSMATQIREYQGLKALPDVYLKEAILNQDLAPQEGTGGDAATEMQAASGLETGKVMQEEHCRVPKELDAWLHEKYNPSQLMAIRDSLKVEGITLVQGPPGTGKTTTVMAILAVLLASKSKQDVSALDGRTTKEKEEDEEMPEVDRVALLRARAPWFQPSYVPFSDQEWQEVGGALKKPYHKVEVTSVFDPLDAKRTPQKVLVCAPSNAAVDEVLRRIKRDGLMGLRGIYRPPMTRMGPGCHEALKEEFGLRNQVDRRLTSSDAPDHNQREEETVRVMTLSRIIFATLAMTGQRDMVGHPEDFDTVVVDEASQGVEMSTLVPLKLGCRRLILIGDPQQLPATVFSKLAKECNYDRSLFQRLQATQYKVNMLNTQYRMHPAISAFPSAHFYNGELLDHLDREAFEKKNPTAWSHIPCFAPVTFFNIEGEMEIEAKSYTNKDEADFIVHLIGCLQRMYPILDWKKKIGIISPYKKQTNLLQNRLRAKYGLSKADPCPIEVNTVDGFQGNEKDCIIVSLVRGAVSRSKSVGFVKDRRRMNVAFTRARLNLWVVGNAKALSMNNDWEDFIETTSAEAKGHAKDSWMLRVTPPFDDWLPGYYKRWKQRMSPDEKLEEVPQEPEEGWHISHEELEELRRQEDELAAMEKDLEEVEDVDDEDEDEVIGKRKADAEDDFVDEEVPTKKKRIKETDET